MKNDMPTWPQMLLILGIAAVGIVAGYMFTNMRAQGERVPMVLPVLFVLALVWFAVAMFFFYFRPQHGANSVRAMLAFFLGHVLLVALLWKIGVLG